MDEQLPDEDGGCKVKVGRGTCVGVPLLREEMEVEEEGRGEEEGGREGDTTGVVLYMGRLGLLSFLFMLSCGVFVVTGVIAGSARGRRE